MVSEWLNVVFHFTSLVPFTHYGDSDYNQWIRASIEGTGCPWRHVIVTTLETFQSRFNHTRDRTGCWEQADLFRQVILDEAHRLCTSGRQLDTNISQTGRSIGVGYFDDSEKTAQLLLGLKPEFK